MACEAAAFGLIVAQPAATVADRKANARPFIAERSFQQTVSGRLPILGG